MNPQRSEIKITNVHESLHKDLQNIAANLGTQLSPFLKIELKKVADSYPPEMKKPRKKD